VQDVPIPQEAKREESAVLAALVRDLARFAEGQGTAPAGTFLRDLADRLSGHPAKPAP
jgi:hypothetical protein